MHASCTHALADRPAELETPQPHAPHIQPRAARSKQKNILSYYCNSSTYGVLCTPPTWCTRKQEEKKKQSCKLPCMRCAVSKPHWPLLTPWELALLCPLAREQNDTATHASSMCMHVSADSLFYIWWWSPSARHPANTIQTARATRVWSDDGQRRSKLAWWRPG